MRYAGRTGTEFQDAPLADSRFARVTAIVGRRLVAGIAAMVIFAACTANEGATPSPTPAATPSMGASAAASASASSAPSESASSSPSATASATATSTAPPGVPAEFEVAANADADALFTARDSCRNPQDGYVLAYPDEWYTNTEIRDVPACSWFSPSFYTIDDFDGLPAEIAIEIFWVAGDRGHTTEVLSTAEGLVGGQYATRMEVAGTAVDAADGESYEYVVQLGPSPEEGPNLVARTDTAMGGDYALNRAVLDRIMATIEFVGSVQ